MNDKTPLPQKSTRPRKKPEAAKRPAPKKKKPVKGTRRVTKKETPANTTTPPPHTDINVGAWIMKNIPESFKPYALLMRLDRPIGIWLLLVPCYWGLLVGMGGFGGLAAHLAIIPLLLTFTLGAVLMRGAGCIINDLWDREIDKSVERTKNRPLANGDITPQQAMIFLGFLLVISSMILFSMNIVTVILGLLALVMVVLYPLMKRLTFWPQAFLGLTFNIGVLMGCAALTGGVTASGFLFYLGAIAWTVCYDTIYARQDIEDDLKLGLKSTAILFGDNIRLCVIGFMVMALGFFVMAGVSAHAFGTYYAMLALPALHAFLTLRQWNENDPQSCLDTFKAQRNFALLILLALLFI